MKTTNFFRALLCGVAVLCGQTASAQNEIVNAQDTTKVTTEQVINQKGEVHYGIDPSVQPKDIYNVLKSNPNDTIVTVPIEVLTDTTTMIQGEAVAIPVGDTLFVHLKYSLQGARSLRRDTIWVLNHHEEELVPTISPLEAYVDSLSQLTQVVDGVNSGRERDRNGYRIRFNNGNVYTITTKAMNKYGWSLGAYAGGEFGGVKGVTAGGRLQYTHKWVSGTLDGGVGTNKYENNAEPDLAGTQMFTFDARAMGWVNILPFFKADTYNQWRVELGGGGGLKGFKTKSREVTNPDGSVVLVQSQGNGWYWAGALKGTYQPFNKGYSFSLEAGISQTPNVWQNEGQKNHLTYYVRVAMTFDVWRNKVNHK